MTPGGFTLPFAICITCLKYNDCPIHSSGARGAIKVPHPDKCVLEQLSPPDLAKLADQITMHLGYLECDREHLGRKLELVLKFMENHNKKVVVG